MLAARRDPFTELNRLQDELGRMFDGRSGTTPRRFGAGVYPPMDMWHDDDKLYVEAELPGFELDDLEIYVNGRNQLSLSGERKPPQTEGGNWHRRERGFGRFNRIVELPCEVDNENVSAEFKHGVLTITLPKSERVKPRRIEVKVV